MNLNKPTIVITHHAVSGFHSTVEDVDIWHKSRWFGFTSKIHRNAHSDFYHVGYHYVIELDGTVTQTRDHDEEGAHTIGMNTRSIGVCFMGNFDKHHPTMAQLQAWKVLYKKLQDEFPGIPTSPHRRYANKSCHGSMIMDNYFRTSYAQLTLIDRLMAQIAKLRLMLAGQHRRMR